VDESQLNKTIISISNAKRRIVKERVRFMEMLPKARLMEAWRFKDKKPVETFLNHALNV
jgi:hypothetical protein